MKKIKEYLVPTVTLFVICLVSALLLALANNATKDKIAQIEADNQQKAMENVLPDCEFGEEKTVTVDGTTYTYAEATKDGNVVGYAITAVGKGAYSGEITAMVGINADGTVAAVDVLKNEETKTVGVKMVINSVEFMKQFVGISGSAEIGKNIDAVSGATKTSTGVTDAVNTALKVYSAITGGEN